MKSNNERVRVLVIEDEEELRLQLRERLEREGYEVVEAPDEDAASKTLTQSHFDIVIADMWMKDKRGGVKAVRSIPTKSRHFSGLETIAIVFTAHERIEDCVAVMRDGAYDFVSKNLPDARERLIESCRRGLQDRRIWGGDTEAQFVRANFHRLSKEHSGKWIAVVAGRVFASERSYADVCAAVRAAAPEARPYIVRIPSSSAHESIDYPIDEKGPL